MKIGGLQKLSLIDYPDEICAIVFTVGCNFRCPYCHNPELVVGNISLLNEDYLFEFLKKRVSRLSAVSITGGEPTLHKDLPLFVEKIKKLGYKVKLDTNGTNPAMLDRMFRLRLIDYVAMDIKAPIEKYSMVVRNYVNVEDIVNSIKLIISSGVDYEFRTTVVRDLLDVDDIINIADLIKGAKRYVLQRFVPSKTLDAGFINAADFDNTELENIRLSIAEQFHSFTIR